MPQVTIDSLIPLWIILVPLLAGIAVFFTGAGRSGRFISYEGLKEVMKGQGEADPGEPGGFLPRSILLLVATVVPLALTGYLYFLFQAGYRAASRVDVLPPLGLTLQADILSLYMTLLFTFFGFILVVYSIGYMRGERFTPRFFGFLLLVYAGSLGVALAGDMFTFFLFFEFMSIMYFVLVVHDPTSEAVAAGMKFLFMTILAGVALFLSVVIIYREAGTLVLDTPGLVNEFTTFSFMAFMGFIIAFGTKAAMFPLHLWMPDAYTHAPLPAATLSSTIMLKTGVYGLVRVFYNIYGLEFWGGVTWDNVLIVVAGFTIVFGSTIALSQDDIIRRLAYSGIAQVGYIILGIAILTPNALVGGMYHITAHAFMKGCMFLCAGAVIKATGNRSIERMKGVGYILPVTMLAFTTAAITAIGMPPFNIFITKWFLSMGALDIGQPVLIVILLVSSLLNAAYYLPIAYYAFLGLEEEEHGEGHGHGHHREFVRSHFREPGALMLVPIIVLALGCLFFNLFTYNWPLEIVKEVALLLNI